MKLRSVRVVNGEPEAWELESGPEGRDKMDKLTRRLQLGGKIVCHHWVDEAGNLIDPDTWTVAPGMMPWVWNKETWDRVKAGGPINPDD